MVIAAEVLAETRRAARRPRRVHEHRRGVQRRRRAGLRAPRRDRPTTRSSPSRARSRSGPPAAAPSTARSRSRAAPGTPSRSTRTGATAARSTRSTRAASCSTASTGCGASGARAPTSATRCSTRRTSSPTRFVADAGWHVTIPDRAEHRPVRADPAPAGRRAGLDGGRPGRGRGVPAPLVRDRLVAGRAPAELPLAHGGQPVRDAGRRAERAALLGANAALGLPVKLGGLGSWYDGATFALEAGHARADVRAARDRLGAHGRRVRPDRRPRRLRAGHRGRGLAGLRLCR